MEDNMHDYFGIKVLHCFVPVLAGYFCPIGCDELYAVHFENLTAIRCPLFMNHFSS